MADQTPIHEPTAFFRDAGIASFYAFDATGCRTPSSGARWSWTSYSLTDTRGRKAIGESKLPFFVKESLLSGSDRYYIEYEDGWLFGEMPDMQHEHYGDGRQPGYFRFSFNGDRFVSGRKHPLQSVDDIRQALDQDLFKPASPARLFERIVRRYLERLKLQLSDLSEKLDSIEDHIVGDAWEGQSERLAPIRRQIVASHRYLAITANLLRQLEHTHRKEFPEELADIVENLSQRAGALHQEGEQLQVRARLLQEELMAKLAHRSNELLYVLSVMTAVLLPSTVISGFFGMNTTGIPFADEHHGFWAVVIFALTISAVVLLIVRRIGRPGR
ncbi:CorA family divalent cation transporter [Mesorhizobium sp. RMAD-H1]|uniref:CorA family divalent cation transporter n=1 Tax=Mesorhizobium sp. RMAD-H1 TaxID=2587065 RepID=UPI0016173136|nr:CorA family divalent cation transporter [Mesorhizobium sp. RMAD-H1]MBB2970253.1 zinc transporter [Mesorhizobium sp. RMAD-H1]